MPSLLRTALLPLLLLAGCLALAAGQTRKISERQISDADLDRILKNDAVTSFYVKCLLGKGTCDREGNELRRLVPMALATGCEGCTDNHKRATDRVIRHLRAKRPRDWVALTAKYDPKGEYEKRYAGVTVGPPSAAAAAAAAPAAPKNKIGNKTGPSSNGAPVPRP